MSTLRKPADVGSRRLDVVSRLPIFWNLIDRRGGVAGGTAAAAWKVDLLFACGANIEIYAPVISTEMTDLIKRRTGSGTLTHHSRTWGVDVFVNADLALTDTDCDAEAQAFYCSATAAGVPVNIINKPALSQFQFGTLVNRYPVVVAVSTGDIAPIFEQAISCRIETLLPASITRWVQLANTIRKTVIAKLENGLQRRTFWERFSDMVFQYAVPPQDTNDLVDLVDKIATSAPIEHGRVTLVGGGPGDVELLTIKAARALQSADIILFDDLVTEDMLELARSEAKRIMVGKRGGRKSCSQNDINDLMVKLAKQGNHVVRLKSGDPMVFGRAGEEIERLKRENISVEVIPGVTAASSLASLLGISLTHRDYAHSVRYVTGHSRSGELSSDLDWKGMADPETTIVFYMGGRTSPSIARRLLENGMPNDMPVLLAYSISRPNMKLFKTTLATLSDPLTSIEIEGPVLVAIGSVFNVNYNFHEVVTLPSNPNLQTAVKILGQLR
ncbi:MAG: uroporphyrinogen-III C-methyltransferase [Hyphomicrobiaceae bacterium]|nr:uroporphyrinogen-III C-methyltransferase [Hyphomicrobiaceae bacterium]